MPIRTAQASFKESGSEQILIVDAVVMGSRSGNAALFEADQVKRKSISTHPENLEILFQVILTASRPQVLVLGLQSKNMEHARGLSKPVQTILDLLTKTLIS